MHKLYIPTPITGMRLLPFLPGSDMGNRLFQSIPVQSYQGILEIVPDIAAADAVLLPHEYVDLKRSAAYLSANLEAAKRAGKKVIISAYQDSPEPIKIGHCIVLRPSAYRSTLQRNEIVMPAYVEDIGGGVQPLPKGAKPTVGFMGKADFNSLRDRARYVVHNYLLRRGPDREGFYFRRRALHLLGKDPRIELNATLRKQYSAHRKSIELSPEQARREYIDSLRNNLFTLAPRGDGNYSLRFYETLSMGRIPVVIDTDMPLPLENTVKYDEFIVRVPWQELDYLSEYILKAHMRSDEELLAMQRKARAAFERYLYMPAFLKQIFAREFLDEIQTPYA